MALITLGTPCRLEAFECREDALEDALEVTDVTDDASSSICSAPPRSLPRALLALDPLRELALEVVRDPIDFSWSARFFVDNGARMNEA